MSAGHATEDKSTAVHTVGEKTERRVAVALIAGTKPAMKDASTIATASDGYGSVNAKPGPPPRQVKQV